MEREEGEKKEGEKNDANKMEREELAAELDADLLKERRGELEAYIWAHLSRFVHQLKTNNNVLVGKLSEMSHDPIIQRLKALAPNYDRNTIVAAVLPDVCRAARTNILP